MTVVRLQPASPPAPDVSNHDRIMAALNRAIEVQTTAEDHRDAVGVAIVWYHEDDSKFSDSYIVQGLNMLETLGLLKMASDDISEYGLNNGPCDLPRGDDPA